MQNTRRTTQYTRTRTVRHTTQYTQYSTINKTTLHTQHSVLHLHTPLYGKVQAHQTRRALHGAVRTPRKPVCTRCAAHARFCACYACSTCARCTRTIAPLQIVVNSYSWFVPVQRRTVKHSTPLQYVQHPLQSTTQHPLHKYL